MKARLLILPVVLMAIVVLMIFEVGRVKHAKAEAQERAFANNAKVPAIERALRPNYPYSVIPGGVYSGEELRRRIKEDTIVGRHYAGFDARSAHLVLAQTDRLEYASYRLQGQVYWTKRKLRIPKGEVLITDGVHLARTRCGNRLSEESPSQTSLQEPSFDALSLPPFGMDLIRRGLLTFANPPHSDSPELPPAPMLSGDTVTDLGSRWLMAAGLAPRLVIPTPATLAPWGSSSAMPFDTYFLAGMPVGMGTSSKGTTQTSTSGTAILPGSPGRIAEVPEPRGLALFAMLLLGSGWGLSKFRHLTGAR